MVREASIFKQMHKLIVPLMLANLLNSLVYIVNGVFVGSMVGESGVSVVANCFPLAISMTAVSTGFAAATAVLVSQGFGADAKEKIKRVMGTSYILSPIVGVSIAAIVIVSSPFLLGMLNTPDAIVGDTRSYLILYAISFPFNHFLLVGISAVRALGDTRTPLLYVGLTTVLNIILVPALITAGLGITGAGLGMLLAAVITMIAAAIHMNIKFELLRVNRSYFAIDKSCFKETLRIGIPVILEQLLIAVVATIETYVSNQSGIIGSAAYGVGTRLEQVFLIVGMSFQTVATVMVGQYIGKAEANKIKTILTSGLKMAVLPMLATAIVVFVFPAQFCRIFVNSTEVIGEASAYLSVLGFAFLLMPIMLLLKGCITGTGHTRYLLLTSLTASVFEVVVMLVFLQLNGDNLLALGLGIVTWVLVDTIMNAVFMLSCRWKTAIKTGTLSGSL